MEGRVSERLARKTFLFKDRTEFFVADEKEEEANWRSLEQRIDKQAYRCRFS
jgi:hypothetical protein